MTRHEIGGHPGLKLETMFRRYSRFHEEGLIQVHGRLAQALDCVALRKVAGNGRAQPRGGVSG